MIELSILKAGLLSDKALSKSAWQIIFYSNLFYFLFLLSTFISDANDYCPLVY